jgi:hypothetical protein
MVRSGLIIIALFTSIAGVGCAGPTRPEAPATPTTPATTASPTPTVAADPRTLLIEPPSTARRTQLDLAPDGLVSVEVAGELYNPDAAAQAASWLRGLGYRGGAYIGWADDEHNEVTVQLLSFRSAVAASQWASGYQQALSQDANVRDTGSLTTVDGAVWYRGAYEGATGYLGAVFAKGAYGVVLRVFRPNTTNHELLESLAKEQYDRLTS